MHEHDYHHKKALNTKRELHWSNYKQLYSTNNTQMHIKEKSNYYSNQLAEEKDSKEMW